MNELEIFKYVLTAGSGSTVAIFFSYLYIKKMISDANDRIVRLELDHTKCKDKVEKRLTDVTTDYTTMRFDIMTLLHDIKLSIVRIEEKDKAENRFTNELKTMLAEAIHQNRTGEHKIKEN